MKKLSRDDYNQMYNNQGGRCLICGMYQTSPRHALDVDYDTETGKVKGLLCERCIEALKLFKKDVYNLRNAMHYLEGKV